MSESERILVVGPSWVGDMVMAQALFRRLRDRDRGVQIDVVAPGWSLPLLGRMAEVRAAVQLDVGHGEIGLLRRLRLGRELRTRRYDRAIVLPRSFKAALVPAFARIARRTGFLGEYRYGLINDVRPFDAARLNQTVKRFLALGDADADTRESLDAIPEPALLVDRDRARALRERHGLSPDGNYIALAPGAEYGPAKRWPAEHFAAVARRCVALGYDVLVIGSAKEASIGASIAEQAGVSGVVDLCGRTELVDAVDLLGCSQAVVCNDSGLMHIAAATGAPLVAIYGSSSPGFTPPLSTRARVLYLALSCSPCFRRECPLEHLDCLRKIEPEEVMQALVTLLREFQAA